MIKVIYKNTPLGEPTEYIRSQIYPESNNFNMKDIGQSSDKYLFIDDSKIPPPMNTGAPAVIKAKIAVVKNIFDNWNDLFSGGFNSDLQIKIHHMTFELYRYHKEVEQYGATSGSDIFAQPVRVHGNAVRSIGILGDETIKQAILPLN
jgi:hypothetical protein